jgi:hypothetical protein
MVIRIRGLLCQWNSRQRAALTFAHAAHVFWPAQQHGDREIKKQDLKHSFCPKIPDTRSPCAESPEQSAAAVAAPRAAPPPPISPFAVLAKKSLVRSLNILAGMIILASFHPRYSLKKVG